MLLYVSTATSYTIYNDLFQKNQVAGGYQSQRFNYNLITGLSKYTKVVSLCSFPYTGIDAERIERDEDDIKYICVKNIKSKLHRPFLVWNLIREGSRIIKQAKPEYIICDAFSLGPAVATKILSKIFRIPSVAIITDIPEFSCSGSSSFWSRFLFRLMRNFDNYVILTEQMNQCINLKNKPFVVMEGSCVTVENAGTQVKKSEKKILLYGGALWKENAGIEYFIDGFIKANLPDTELHFYGTGELTEHIRNISSIHHQVKYMGCITNQELVEKQKEATLLINPRPSTQEFCKYSFPSKTFEYMLSGTPVLMTRLPGIPDEYFKYAYTIDEENADGVCAKLLEIFSIPDGTRETLGKAARKFVATQKNNIMQSKKIYDFLMMRGKR